MTLLVVTICLILLLLYLTYEAISHQMILKSIPVRVHVNGTRGKSSVARLIAAGMRAGGLKTTVKTTGTLARIIDPDGNEIPVYRIGFANIGEQIAVFKKAKKWKSNAIVIECMALQPLLQSVCERMIVKSTHGVLTNARPDHLDVMGPTDRDVALAMAATTPIKADFYTAEDELIDIYHYTCKDRKSNMHHITNIEADLITDEEINKFCYSEFKINVALALKVCIDLKIDREVALQGMYAAKPDPGAMTLHDIDENNRIITFANAFAANDPVSTGQLWVKLTNDFKDYSHHVILVNCRADRAERTQQMADAILSWTGVSLVVVMGSGTEVFNKHYKASVKTIVLESESDEGVVLEEIQKYFLQGNVLIVGVANIAGIGLRFIDLVQEKENKRV